MVDDNSTYKSAGIDIDETDDAKTAMAGIVASDRTPLNRFGAFASVISLELASYKNPVLVMKTEEPGSKQMLAFKHDRIESVCADMINHLVNDCIVMGAKPLAVQDAIICGRFNKERVLRIVRGVSEACRLNDCVLVGGETSIQPGVVPDDGFILTSCIVGLADRDRLVDGRAIKVGDSLVAVASNGLHTNGYTLVRKLMTQYAELQSDAFVEQALAIHTAYYPALKSSIADGLLVGMAHITGGGIRDNLRRVLPSVVDAVVDLSEISVPTIFKTIKTVGRIADEEMLRTFNCGVGMVLVLRQGNVSEVVSRLRHSGLLAYQVGVVRAGRGDVELEGALQW